MLRLGAHRPEPAPSTGVLDFARLAEHVGGNEHRQQDYSRNSPCDLSDHGRQADTAIPVKLNFASKSTEPNKGNQRHD